MQYGCEKLVKKITVIIKIEVEDSYRSNTTVVFQRLKKVSYSGEVVATKS